MATLPESLLDLLNALVDAPMAWRTPEQLAATLGRDVEEATDQLCELDLSGWLVTWDAEGGPAVTLSALGAERLGVRLVEEGLGGTVRWARAGDPDPRPARSRNVCQTTRGAALDYIRDGAPPPDVAAERGERIENRERAQQASGTPHAPRGEDLKRPTLLVGVGMTPWPGPHDGACGPCPACLGRELSPHMYCLYCDRWGLDAPKDRGVAAAVASPTPARAGRVTEGERKAADLAQAERMRAKRRAKRARKRAARREQARPVLTAGAAAAAMDFSRPPR